MGLKAISLFSGAGGLDVGFESAGFETVFACELNTDSAETWKTNRPDNASAMYVGDINQKINSLSIYNNISVVYGGPPCQGFSVAGKMSSEDPRNELIKTFLEVVEVVQPRVFLIENVKNLAVSPRWKRVRDYVSAVSAKLDYNVEFNIINSADYGVPENRERLIVIGVKNDVGMACSFASALKSLRRESGSVRNTLLSVGQYDTEDNPNTCPAKIVVAKSPVVRKSAYSGMLVNGAGRPLRLDGLSQTLTASMGGNNTPIVDQRALEDSNLDNWFECLYRMIVSGSNYIPTVAPNYVRRLTVKEAAAIQSFPEGYVFSGSPCSQYRQIGNAVPCLFAEAMAMTIKKEYFTDSAD